MIVVIISSEKVLHPELSVIQFSESALQTAWTGSYGRFRANRRYVTMASHAVGGLSMPFGVPQSFRDVSVHIQSVDQNGSASEL